jgi:hypothetical protein
MSVVTKFLVSFLIVRTPLSHIICLYGVKLIPARGVCAHITHHGVLVNLMQLLRHFTPYFVIQTLPSVGWKRFRLYQGNET